MKQGLPDSLLSNTKFTFLAARYYTDPELLPHEIQAIFRRTWLYVGDAANLSTPNNVWVTEAANCSLLITRESNNILRAFYNVCPHRASVLVSQTGVHSLKKIVCPYHAWVYELDGQLRGTPAKDRFPDSFRYEELPLKTIRSEQWQG